LAHDEVSNNHNQPNGNFSSQRDAGSPFLCLVEKAR